MWRVAVAAGVVLVPVKDPPDEWGHQGDSHFGARDRLVKAEQQGQVAMDPFLFELLGGADALPGRGDLDQHPFALNAGRLVVADELVGLGNRALHIVGQARIGLGRNSSCHDVEDADAELHGQPVDCPIDDGFQMISHFLAGTTQRGVDHVAVLWHLSRRRNQRGIRRCVAWFEPLDGVEVTGVSDDNRHLAQLLVKVLAHLDPSARRRL